jgi:hypothetical protein
MPFAVAAGIGAVGSIAGGLLSGGAAKSAANTQANAADQAAQTQLQAQQAAIAEQQRQFDALQQQLAPFSQAASGSGGTLSQLQNLLRPGGGLAPSAQDFAQPGPVPQYNMPAFTAQQFKASPGYNYQLGQAQNSIQNSAVGRTGALSGNMLQGLQQNATGLASQDWWSAYNAYAQNYQNQFNANNQNYWLDTQSRTQSLNNYFAMLNALTGQGQSAAAGQGAAGIQTGSNIANTLLGTAGNIGNLQTSAGAAQAAGQVGSANAFTGGINSLSNLLLSPYGGSGGGFNPSQTLIGQLLGGGGGAGGGGANQSPDYSTYAMGLPF